MTTIFECPCGRKYIEAEPAHTFESSVKFDQVVASPPAVPAQPKVSGAREYDVAVPFWVSVISGSIVAAFFLVIGAELRWGVGVGLFVTGCVWAYTTRLFFKFRGEKIKELVWRAEEYLGDDIDGDSHVGEPGRTVIDGRGKKRPRSWGKLTAADMAIDRVAFARRFWELEQRGAPTGQKAMRGFELPSGFKLNDKIHEALVRDLKDANLGYNTNNGFVLYSFESAAALEAALQRKVTVGD